MTGCALIEEIPPGEPNKTDYVQKELVCDDINLFSDIIAIADEETNDTGNYFLGEADVWLDRNGEVEIVNLYYYDEQSDYKMLKFHFTMNEYSATLEYISYYKDTEYVFESINNNELNENILLESCAEVKVAVSENNGDEYFAKIYSNDNMYVMEMKLLEDEKYRLMELREKIDGEWKISYERDKDNGYISKPMPERK